MSYWFKSVEGSDYEKAIKRYREQAPLWNNVMDKLSELLGTKINAIARETKELFVNLSDLSEEVIKLFTIDGKLKRNSKKANQLRKKYFEIIEQEGLSDFGNRSLINFSYGIIRTHPSQNLSSFISSEGTVYIKASFDLMDRAKTNNSIQRITEIEFEEKYLSELKKREDQE